MNTDGPRVSLVIPAYNEQSSIRRCLLAAIGQSRAAHEILVVDNRSTDRTAEIANEIAVEFPDAGVRVVPQHEAQGLIPTRNRGFDVATGDVLGRIDADTIIEPGWVETLSETFRDSTIAAATGPVGYYDMPLRSLGVRADDRVRRALLKFTKEYHFVFGSNMAVRADAWRAIRDHVALDEADLLHEDIDISINLALAGMNVAYRPDLVAGISSRRLEDGPRAFYNYAKRFDRTYDYYGLPDPALRAPIWILLGTYLPLKLVRAMWQRQHRRWAPTDDAAHPIDPANVPSEIAGVSH